MSPIVSNITEEERQKIMADWKGIAQPILDELAKEIQKQNRKVFISDIGDEGDLCGRYSEDLSFHVGPLSTHRRTMNRVTEIHLCLNSSEEYEGEFFGWGIMLHVHAWGGKQGPQYAPDNYTEDCFKPDWETVKKRTEDIRQLIPMLATEILKFRDSIR